MNIFEWEYITLIPPLLILLLVIFTRKVLLSLGVGILLTSIVINKGNILEAIGSIWGAFSNIFYADGEINTWNAYILIFLILLGCMIAFVTMTGGTKSFSEMMLKRIRTRRASQFFTGILGMLVFIDDYFSALIVGQVSRPITDAHKVSRAKLSYYIDTTSSPICVISPISSWGAGIMGLMAPVLIAAELNMSAFSGFIQTVPYNFYAISSIVVMFIVIIFKVDIGMMRDKEKEAIYHGSLVDESLDIPGEVDAADLPILHGTYKGLIIPVTLLIITVFTMIIFTGYQESGYSFDFIKIFENTKVTDSLVVGGLVSLIAALIYYFKQSKQEDRFEAKNIGTGFIHGVRSMLPAVYILTLAWMTGDLIAQMGTGDTMANIINGASIPVGFMLAVFFFVAGVMALTTGTSWGSFGILIPIAGEIMMKLDAVDLIIPSIAAVLAGSVFGDHCSPISDSTILSSTGAGCNHIVHVLTQMPYAIIAAVVSLTGYVVLGFTSSLFISLSVVIVLLVVLTLLAYFFYKPIPRKKKKTV